MKYIYILVAYVSCVSLTNIDRSMILNDQKTPSFSQSCKAKLVTEKNRPHKSINDGGVLFTLMLTNTSTQSSSFELLFKDFTESCVSENKKIFASDDNLNIEIQDVISKKAIDKKVFLQTGESYKFNILVTLKKQIEPFNRWTCIKIIANNASCETETATTVLKIYAPNPSEG